MKLIKLVFFVCLFFSLSLFSQQKQINTLKNKLATEQLNDSAKIKVYGDLGWYYGNVNIDSSFHYTKLGLKLAKATNNENGIAQSYNDIGIIHYRISDFDSSIVYYKKALTLRKKLKDSLRIAAIYNKIGISNNQLFKLDSAIFYTIESLKIYESLGMQKQIAISNNNIANLYRDTKQHQKALETHRKSLAVREEIKDEVGQVQSFVGIGNIYVFLQQNDSAKYYYKKAQSLGEKLNLKRDLSTVYNNLGSIYRDEGNFNLATNLISKSLTIREQLQDNYGIASSSLNLGDLYFRRGLFSRANKNLHKALNVAKSINANELILNTYKTFIQLKGYLNQPDSVVFYQQKHAEVQDTFLNKKIAEETSKFQVQYQTEKKEKEIAIQKQELLDQELKIKNRNLYVLILLGSIILLSVIFWGLYKRNKLKRLQLQKEMELKDALAQIKTQNKLQEQRLEISRDLHDNIGSQLTFIISSIDNLKFISKDINQQFQDKLNSISSFTFDTIHQLRDTIWAMNKNEITGEEFLTRLMSYIEKVKQVKPDLNFEINDQIKEQLLFTSIQGMNLFRVIQECINNTVKHAEAKTISIQFSSKNNQISATIKDDGKGFNKESVNLGNGLSNIETRIQSINGKVNIQSEENKGTKVSIAFKL